ncbi:MAG: response regulator, partial [Bacteroidota bacterium]|nr:response regulator [Bacteroidota bacterium]
LKSILVEAGHEVVGEASNGYEAVELYGKLSPDIITLDITMPELNGIEALKKIIEINKDATVIMLTSISKPDSAIEALNNGAKNYITKPFDKDKVLKAINAVSAAVSL